MTAIQQTADNSYGASKACASSVQEKLSDRMGIMAEVRLIGGALVMILMVVFVLTEIYEAVEISEGPFSEVGDSLTSIGPTALTLLVLALLVIAASAIMRFFGSGGFGAR